MAKGPIRGVIKLTVRERLLAINLMKKEARNPRYAAKIGVHVYLKAASTTGNMPKEKNHV